MVASITLTAVNDFVSDDDETLVVDVVSVANAVEFAEQRGVATITEPMVTAPDPRPLSLVSAVADPPLLGAARGTMRGP